MQDRDWQAEICLLQRRVETARCILGISDSDSIEKIKLAWRKLSLNCHPDCNDGGTKSHRMFVLINSAYRCLTKNLDCEQLDAVPTQDEELTDGKYKLDNPWGYFAWWREKYFNWNSKDTGD